MRPLDQWDKTDLLALIKNEVPESLYLDYKRSAALSKDNKCIAELSKDVSAFANSAGGRIIYGIAEEHNRPVALDGGVPPGSLDREWIEQIIHSRIRPRIAGVVIKPIALDGGGTAYVIDIPQAMGLAPHQADNHCYYRRYNFISVAMHDYEVKDAMRRSSSGDPYISLIWVKMPIQANSEHQIRLQFIIGNRASEPVMYSKINIYIDQRLLHPDAVISEWSKGGIASFMVDAKAYPAIAFSRSLSVPSTMPIFMETEWLLAECFVAVPPIGDYAFGYDIYSPGVSRRVAGFIRIDDSGLTPLGAEMAEMLTPSHKL